MAELIELLISFIKIGFTSFGGASMVPLINAEMLSHHWMTTTEVADIVAIAEMTPGPLGTNCATFAGMRVAGVLGAMAHSVGQMVMAVLLTGTPGLAAYLPVMLLIGVFTGAFTGLCAQFLTERLK